MAEGLRLFGHLPPQSLLRRRDWQRFKGSFGGVSSTPFVSSSSIRSPGFSVNRRSEICCVAAAPSTSSTWNIDEEGRPEGDNSQEKLFDDAVGPVSIELETIADEARFDQISADAEKQGVPFVVVWMAHWCRKCIYLKPKLERLAASYHPRVHFYSVDVNSVPHKFVKRAGVTRMPTIQIWKDSAKQSEMVGGHKAWQVINDVRQMIENVI